MKDPKESETVRISFLNSGFDIIKTMYKSKVERATNLGISEIINNYLAFAFCQKNDGQRGFIEIWAKPHLSIEIIDANSACLWNYTEETQHLLLSVNP